MFLLTPVPVSVDRSIYTHGSWHLN